MYSLNAPVPAAVAECRDGLAPVLEAFDTVRDPLTLVVKRFGDRSPAAVDALERTLSDLLLDREPFEARIARLGAFTEPPGGPAPVLYLAVDSPGLESLHLDLVERFGAADRLIEGTRYVPHVTLARGGGPLELEAVLEQPIEPVEWTIDELVLWTARYEQVVGTVPLGARP